MGAALSFFVLEGLVALRGGIRSRIPMIRPRLPQHPLLHGVTLANLLTKDIIIYLLLHYVIFPFT